MGPGSRALFLLHCIALAPPLKSEREGLGRVGADPCPEISGTGDFFRPSWPPRFAPRGHPRSALPRRSMACLEGAGAAGCEVNCSVFHVAHYWGTEA